MDQNPQHKKSFQKQEECLSRDGQLKRALTFFILQLCLTQNRSSGAVIALPWWKRARASANSLVLFLVNHFNLWALSASYQVNKYNSDVNIDH